MDRQPDYDDRGSPARPSSAVQQTGRRPTYVVVLIDALTDAVAVAAIAVACVTILVTNGLYWVDPVLALGGLVLIAIAAIQPIVKAIAA